MCSEFLIFVSAIMSFKRKLLITFIGFFCLPATVSSLLVTPLGCIEGKLDFYHGIPVRTYLGIPYAKPPIGDFRFKKPVPFGSWKATLQATTLRPGCAQYLPNPFPWGDFKPGKSINCLYLNIWTPGMANTSKKKSVMIWLHGGGFRVSSSRNDFYNGQVLAAEGDVVVVTFNYRLGAEGFLYSGTEDAPGNMGIWDMVEALKWVRNNIHYFGGDKNSITLFGQSAGSIAIGMLCTSPITKGLFKRVIMQSGSPLNMGGEENDRSFKISQKLAVAVNCAYGKRTLSQYPKTVVECLKGKDGFELAVALSNVTADSPRSYYPRYGDELFPTNPRLAIINGDFTPVDVLIGSNSGEGATLVTKSMKNTFGFFGEKYPQINYTFGESIIRNQFKNFPDPDAVVMHYLGKEREGDYNEIRFEVFTASGDYSITCPINYFAESFAEKGSSVYYYYFIHRPSYTVWAPWMLAVHHDETPFVFGYPLRYPHFYTWEELMLSRRLIKAWSNFAKTGKPELGGWPLYSKKQPVYQVLDVNNITGMGPHRRNCDFFRQYFKIH